MTNQNTRITFWILLLAASGLAVICTLFSGIFSSDPVVASQREAAAALSAVAGCVVQTDESGHVITVRARGPAFTDAVAARLQELPDLRSLQLPDCEITNEVLEFIASLSRLERLHLNSTGVTSAGLTHLTQLSNLTELVLADCELDDGGMKMVAQLNSLRILNLDGTNVTDEGLEHLAALQNIEKLYLGGTEVEGTGFAKFDSHDDLIHLSLPDTRLTEKGLSSLKNLRGLQVLYLDGVKFTAPMLQRLMDVAVESFPQLTGLFLSRTLLEDESVDTLMALANMPGLAIVRLDETRISKQAFLRLAKTTPDIRYMVDYPASNDPDARD